jgi:hypothetical protein
VGRVQVVQAACVRKAKRESARCPLALHAFVEEVSVDLAPILEVTRQDVLTALDDLVNKGILARSTSAATTPYQLGISYIEAPPGGEDEDRGGALERDSGSSTRKPSFASGTLDHHHRGVLPTAHRGGEDDDDTHCRHSSAVVQPSLLRKVAAMTYVRSATSVVDDDL